MNDKSSLQCIIFKGNFFRKLKEIPSENISKICVLLMLTIIKSSSNNVTAHYHRSLNLKVTFTIVFKVTGFLFKVGKYFKDAKIRLNKMAREIIRGGVYDICLCIISNI